MKIRTKVAAAGMSMAALAAAGCMTVGGVASAGTRPPTPATPATPRTFIAVTAHSHRLAVYSAGTGKLVKYLTSARPGLGVQDPELSADGRTVFFVRDRGNCAMTIDSVPMAGGAEHVVVSTAGAGQHTWFPNSVSISADGKYLMYETTGCDSDISILYLRNLRTGRTVTVSRRAPVVGSGAVFLDRDSQVAYQGPGVLVVLNLATMRQQYVVPQRGCVLGPVAGTTVRLAAAEDCPTGLRLVGISVGTLKVTATIATLNSHGEQTYSVSIAARNTSAALVELATGAEGKIMKFVDGKPVVVAAGPDGTIPQSPVW